MPATTTAALRAHITYEPPDGGQGLTAKPADKAWAAVRSFLESCTDWSGEYPGGTLELWDVGRFTAPEYDPASLIEAARHRLGSGDRYGGINYLDAQLRPEGVDFKTEWKVPPEDFEWAVAFIAHAPRWPREYVGPASFAVSFSGLRLRHPSAGTVLEGQDAPRETSGPTLRSRVFLSLDQAPSASFDLAFPFAEPDEHFLAYIGALRPQLPIRMAWTRFRHQVPNAKGTRYASRKISPGLFDGL